MRLLIPALLPAFAALAALGTLAPFPQWAIAQATSDGEIVRRAENNLSHEMTICAAYYAIAAEGMRRSRQEDSAAKLESTSSLLLERSRNFNPDKVVLARYQLALQDMIAEIDSNIENISVLLVKYADSCKAITEKPEERLTQLFVEALNQALRAEPKK